MDDEKEEFTGFELSENLINATNISKENLYELIYSEIQINHDDSAKSSINFGNY